MTASEQSRKDAMLDAETLRTEWDRHNLSIALWTDARPGYTVRAPSIGVPPEWTVDEIVTGAILAARAAFRAVPGLRGE